MWCGECSQVVEKRSKNQPIGKQASVMLIPPLAPPSVERPRPKHTINLESVYSFALHHNIDIVCT